MQGKTKAMLIAAAMLAATVSQPMYKEGERKGSQKSELTKKQQKQRASAKRAKQARKRNNNHKQ